MEGNFLSSDAGSEGKGFIEPIRFLIHKRSGREVRVGAFGSARTAIR